MVTAAQMRKAALALPEVEEKSHFAQPDFRVRNKIFAGMSPDEQTGTLKLTSEVQSSVLSARPDAFFAAAGAWGRSGWTHFKLSELELGALQDLLLEAWRLVSPKKLLAAHGGGAAAAQPTRRKPARREPAAPKRKPGKHQRASR
jgi:hypothetical protein